MQETHPMKRTNRKVSGVHDIKMLDRLDNAKKFESPANVVLARGVAGIKIKDIPKNTTLKGKAINYALNTNVEQSFHDPNKQICAFFRYYRCSFRPSLRHFETTKAQNLASKTILPVLIG